MATISFTELATWKACRQKHRWRYKERLTPNRYAEHVTLGTLCHAGMEAVLTRQPIIHAVEAKCKEIEPKELFEEEKQALRDMTILAAKVVLRNVPTYATVGVEIPFQLRIPGSRHEVMGRIDAILNDGYGNLWLAEWKFPKSFRNEEDCHMSSQIAIYHWAALKLGYPVVGVIYHQILPRVPAIPVQNKDGSTSKVAIFTDWDTYRQTVIQHGNDPDDYLDMIPKLVGREFSRTYRIYRRKEQIDQFARELRMVASDIASPRTRVYPSESPINCSGCVYRDLCMEVARGQDPGHLIDSSFTRTQNDDTNESTGGVET